MDRGPEWTRTIDQTSLRALYDKTGPQTSKWMLRTILLLEDMPEMGKAMEALGAMIAAVPVVRTAGLGTL